MAPCRSIVDDCSVKNEGAKDQNYLSLMANIGVIKYEDKGDVGNKKPDDLGKCKIVRTGDLVINSMNYAIGSYGMSPYDGVCSPVYIVLRSKEEIVHRRYALRLFENAPFQKYLSIFGNGILEHRAAIGWDDIKGAYIPLPPKNEQLQILQFLDHETAKIDRLIEKQQALIALLKEKRQAVISHAVTKGLNPSVPLKDSGIEWLGQVPAHWGAGKLGYSAKIANGATPSRDNASFWSDGSIGWLNSGKVNDEVIYEADQFITKLAVRQTSVQSVQEGDLLIAITGEGQTRGRVAICKLRATINQHLAAIALNRAKFNSEYMFLWLTSKYERIRFESEEGGSTKAAITCADIAEYPVPIPPIGEQIEIVSYVERKRRSLDKLMENAAQQTMLLEERRTAIISAAVTGKIDLRDWEPLKI